MKGVYSVQHFKFLALLVQILTFGSGGGGVVFPPSPHESMSLMYIKKLIKNRVKIVFVLVSFDPRDFPISKSS